MAKEPIQVPTKDMDSMHRTTMQLKQAVDRLQGAGSELPPITSGQHGALKGGNLHAEATTAYAGFLSSADKTKLDGIEEGAQVNPTVDEILADPAYARGLLGLGTISEQDADSVAITGGTIDAVTMSGSTITGLAALGFENGSTINNVLTATAVLDFSNVVGFASEDLTITVTGAAVGDPCFLGLSAPPAGAVFTAFVSSSNTVTVRFTNATASDIDPASATYRVVVFQF